jgi:hypothetical protein
MGIAMRQHRSAVSAISAVKNSRARLGHIRRATKL